MSELSMKYFPKPTHVSVDEEGSVLLEYAQSDKRCLISIDPATDKPVGVYISFVSRDEMWLEEVKTVGEIAKVLREKMGLVAE